jgi:hypothetical protein
MVAWFVTSPPFDHCFFAVALGDFAGASSQEREMFRFNAGISTTNDG